VKEFLELAFGFGGLDQRQYLVIDGELYRPSEVYVLQGDASKARKKLGWQPTVSFQGLVEEMVKGDLVWYSKYKNPYTDFSH
jgi:GDPmannose 4,6-dehydratase